jgi:hypothetical protein
LTFFIFVRFRILEWNNYRQYVEIRMNLKESRHRRRDTRLSGGMSCSGGSGWKADRKAQIYGWRCARTLRLPRNPKHPPTHRTVIQNQNEVENYRQEKRSETFHASYRRLRCRYCHNSSASTRIVARGLGVNARRQAER